MARNSRPAEANAFYESLGARLRIAREIRGFTQTHVGKRLGLTRTSVINIEQGRQALPLHQFVKLTDILGVSYRLLLTGTSQRGKPPTKPLTK